MLSVLPTGDLALNDLTGTISLDLSHAVAIPEDSAWFTPGMIILVDGIYEEEEESMGKGLGASNGIGGVIGGRFQGFFIGQPPCEKRKATLGVSGLDGGQDHTIGGGFGWIDFLGVGSERAAGSKMRKLEHRLLRQTQPDPDVPSRNRIIIVGELNLDQPRALQALRKILTTYAMEPEGSSPMTFVLAGNFTQHAVMAGGGASGGSVEYKEYFDSLASVLTDFPTLLQSSTFVFVPGDNDGWASSFSSGSAVPLPRKVVPDMFTSRIRRAFATANAEGNTRSGSVGEAIWTSNPARLSVFGPTHEIVLFRDDMSARLRRTAVRLKSQSSSNLDREHQENNPPPLPQRHSPNPNDDDIEMASALENTNSMDVEEPSSKFKSKSPDVPHDVQTARRLVKTVLDQGFLCPFRNAIRPVHWDYAGALLLYPLPTALVLVDPTAPPFALTYEGCHVMNPGPILVAGRRGVGRWIEYELGGTGSVRECMF
jgi:DNA polymerase epsilon subunit 2